jgi:hypothetical protein
MKAKTAELVSRDPRIWCGACRIRIAPTEERIERGEHQYHLRCRPKPHRSTDRHLMRS